MPDITTDLALLEKFDMLIELLGDMVENTSLLRWTLKEALEELDKSLMGVVNAIDAHQ